MKKGGSVHNYISYLHVDAIPGVDNTGETSSTEAILSVLRSILGRDNSVYNYGETKFFDIWFGNGVYQCSLPLISGVEYHIPKATRIIPDPGTFAFYSKGTSDYYVNRVNGARLIAPAISGGGFIGDFQEQTADSPFSGSGIDLSYCSYATIKDITMYRLTGYGIKMDQNWDGVFMDVRIMECSSDYLTDGESSGLYIGPGETTSDDGSNALKIEGLHIENCTKNLTIKNASRHIFFGSGTKIEGITSTVPCTIEGANAVTFTGTELTWSKSNIPMFYMVEDPARPESANKGVKFLGPSIYSPENASRHGWYFQYASSKGVLLLRDVDASFASRIISGSDWDWDGGTLDECGTILAIMEGDCTMTRVTSRRTAALTTDPHVYVNGLNCSVEHCTLQSMGSVDDTASVIRVSALAIDASIQHNKLYGARNYAIRLENEACRPFVYDNRIVHGGTFGAPVYGWYQTYTPASRDTSGFGIGGVASKGATTISSGASSTMTARGAHIIAIRAVISSGYAAALLFVDASTGTISKVADPTGTFSVTAGTSGDGLIHLSQNAGVLTITNYTAVAITVYATGVSALM